MATEPDGGHMIFSITTQPTYGRLDDDFDPNQGTVTYIPNKDWTGDDNFQFKGINEAGSESNIATVYIVVRQTPVAKDQYLTFDKNKSLPIKLEATDPEMIK